jgi:predicted RND superfamily exporter protein
MGITGINNIWHSSFDNWCWLHLRQSFIKYADQGILFSMSMSFLVLLLTTKNFYISVMAILSISAIILGLMSMVNLFGWEFGIIESTCVIIFIGISVDYVVHICHQYIHAMDNQRKQRMDFAFKNMGATILGGALTSSFSAFFLIIC